MFNKLLKNTTEKLSKYKIPYMIIGGQAVLLYGEPRLTMDIDITLGIGIDQVWKIDKIIKELNLKSLTGKQKDFIKNTMVFPVYDKKTGIRIDFIFSFSPYERQAIERAKKVKIGNSLIKYASLEDIVIHKIIAGRPRDIEDVKVILLKNRKCNFKYVLKWLRQFEQITNKDMTKLFNKIKKGALV